MTAPARRPSIVLLAYYFPPLGGIGSQRALSFARHLPAFGFDVTVVSPTRGAYGLDASLDAAAVRVVRTGSFEPAVLARKLRPSKTSAASAAGDMVEGAGEGGVRSLVRKALQATVYFPDHARGWVGPAARAAVKAARATNAAAIVSTSPPVSAHVAALRAAKKLGLPAVLDFRDLWTAHRDGADLSRRAERERELERELLRDAAAVTTVSDVCRNWLASRGGGDAGRFFVLRNGFEEEDFAGPAPQREAGVFRIVHAGTAYGARQDTTAFFRALAKVRAEGAFGTRRVECVFAGKVDGHTTAAAHAAGCGDLFLAAGFVPHTEAVRLMRTATVNLLMTWSVPGPQGDGACPGKMYEQMAAGRPVLALALRRSEARTLLAATGGALVADPLDESEIAGALRRFAAADAEADAAAAAPPRAAEVTRFSRRSVARELASLLASVTR